MHLFDIDIPGKITFKESLTLTPGEGLTVVDTDVSVDSGQSALPSAFAQLQSLMNRATTPASQAALCTRETHRSMH